MKWLWERLFGRPASQPAAPANDSEDLLEDIRQQIRTDVAAGFDGEERILESAVELYAGEIEPELAEAHARRTLAEELAAHAAEQRTWPETTDCDRLDAAFAALNAKGIVARHHFTCCGTCGTAEMLDEMDEAKAQGSAVHGYTFYHWQDTERAVDGDGIFLNYGDCDENEAAALAVGRAIVEELERHGLRTNWDGSWDTRIGVELDWKRRRSA